MRLVKVMESSRVIPEASVKSIDVRLMSSYAVVSVLLLIAIFVFSGHSEPDASQFVSNLVLP